MFRSHAQKPVPLTRSSLSAQPQQYQNTRSDIKPLLDTKPFHSVLAPMAGPSKMSDRLSAMNSADIPSVSANTGAPAYGGSRAEPPKRMYDVEGLSIVDPSLDELMAGNNG